jgi:hypothetical protein
VKTKKRDSGLYEKIEQYRVKYAQHISELIDVICVAQEATIPLTRHILIGPNLDKDEKEELAEAGSDNLIATQYTIHEEREKDPLYLGAVLAGFIHDITVRLAFYEASIRDWADHLSHLGFYGGIGRPIYWTEDELSGPVVRRLLKDGGARDRWSKWSRIFS